MPLLNKKPLEKNPVPENISPADRVYFCEATDEIFQTYDEFFDRMMQLNSTIWSCEFTNRSGLTFFEAQDSEKQALATLESFPSYLEAPILWIVQNLSCRGRFDDLLNDMFNFIKDRYFIGEELLLIDQGKKKSVRILGICNIADWTGNDDSKNKDIQAPPPENYRYTLQIIGERLTEDDLGEREHVQYTLLSRNKQVATKPKMKILLKNSCSVKNSERYEVKEKLFQEHSLDALTWLDVFAGPQPLFPRTPMLQRGRQPKSCLRAAHVEHDSSKENADGVKDIKPTKTTKGNSTPKTRGDGSPRKKNLTEKRKGEIIIQQTELFITFEKARRLGVDNLERWQQEERVLTKREIDNLNDLIKEARKRERDANAKKKEALLNWNRKRDDLDCDDQKPLPTLPALPLPEWLDDQMFGECLSILQFFNTFAEVLPIKDFKGTSRITLSDIVIALRCSDPQNSSLAALLQILLQARTDVCDEEEGDEVDLSREKDLALEQNPDYDHPDHGVEIRRMTKLHEEIRYTYGCSVRNLPTDWLTMTEVLRLILLTSGYVTRQAVHRHRLFGRGSIRFYEDPAYIFRQDHPELVEKMSTGTIFSLSPAEKLLLIQVTIQQLLSYAKFRNHVSERIEENVSQRKELKKLRCWDASQEAEAKDSRLLREMERDGDGGETPVRPKASKETLKLKGMLKAAKDGKRCDMNELQAVLLENVSWNELELDEIISARDLQKGYVQEGIDKFRANIFELGATFGHCSLGRDRAFRNYSILEQVPLIIVENPQFEDRIGVCIEETPCKDKGEFATESEWRDAVLCCSGIIDTCVVHGERRSERMRWSYVESPQKLDEILASFNVRGLREIDLGNEIEYCKPEYLEVLEKTASKTESGQLTQWCMKDVTDPILLEDSIDWPHEMAVLILDFEEKMEQGMLGHLPSSMNRVEWRKLLEESKDITPLIKEDVSVFKNEKMVIWELSQLSTLELVHKLAIAFVQLIQAINVKYFKKPFTRAVGGGVVDQTWTLVNWQISALECKSIPALALHLYSIEPCIQWDKSRLQGNCSKCRRKGVVENLLLCIECDKCFHLGCARPKQSSVVSNWLCHSCEKNKKVEEVAVVSVDVNGHDENESIDEGNNSVIATASGRKVKKAEYNIDRLTSLAPPKKKFRESITRKENSSIIETETEEEESSETSEEMETDNERENNRRSRRKSKLVVNDEVINRSFSIGLRDSDPLFKDKMKALENVVRTAMKEVFCWPFLEPVDAKEVPDYYDIIKKPMDLRTMINKMKNHDYDTIDQVRMDADLIVINCKKYNEDTSEIYECAERLQDFWLDHMKPILNDRKRRR